MDTGIHDRTHLMAKEFGGNGAAPNRTIVYRWINQYAGQIRNFEIEIGNRIATGEVVEYAVGVIFPEGNNTFVPDYFVMEAYGNAGTHMIEVIPNVPK